MLISVILPVYNAREDELRKAIECILNQTHHDIEFIIINDASTNNSEDVILSYDDSRIRYFKNDVNLKITRTLNRGLELCHGKYIARLDSDDYSTLDRLEKQAAYMEANPNVGLLGTFFNRVNTNVNVYSPHKPKDVVLFMRYVRGCIPHSSAMIRKSVLDTHNLKYDTNCLHAEDHKLWSDMSRFCDLAVYPEVLTFLKAHEDGISLQNEAWQAKMVGLINLDNIIKDFAVDKKYFYSILVKYVKGSPITNQEYEDIRNLLFYVAEFVSSRISPPFDREVGIFVLSMANYFVRESNV